ncbi:MULTISPECIES: sulfotransferase [unclassified Thioalkalivibrio]|uniref:sulfotransferase n=1 Tax=unclassified Thioalkalivibrio TaxID=2621013 RepID=UPI0009DA192C|nr:MULTISPECIES: sulfotransferase [unclassified Thioalkalivibrio]
MSQRCSPIVVVGSGRSGTTFLAKLLDSHPRVLYRHEPDWALVDRSIPFLPGPDDRERCLRQAGEYLRRLENVRALKVSGKEPFFRKSYRSSPREAAYRLNVAAARLLDRVGIAQKRDTVRDMVGRGAPDNVVTVIKSVNSVARAPLFADALPRVRLVHIVRHPAGVIASRLRGADRGLMDSRVYINSLFDAGYADQWAWQREEVKSWPIEKQLAFEWMVVNEFVYRSLETHEAYMCVTHEALSRSTEAETRKIFAHAGLDWNEQTAGFVQSLTSRCGQSGYFDVQRAPETQIAKWREELTEQQVSWIEEVVTPSLVGKWFL